MSVAVAAASPGLVYLPWNPVALPVPEPDSWLLNMDHEESLTTLAQGRMTGANEEFGDGTDKPYWLGGSKVARVGNGLKCQGDTTFGYLSKACNGLWDVNQGTVRFDVTADIAWSAITGLGGAQTAFQVLADSVNYLKVPVGPSGVGLRYRHRQLAAGEINQTVDFAHSAGAGLKVNVALTMLASVLTLYINGVSAGTLAGCTPARAWHDNWVGSGGIAISVGAPNLTVSDLAIYRLARIPGVVPGP